MHNLYFPAASDSNARGKTICSSSLKCFLRLITNSLKSFFACSHLRGSEDADTFSDHCYPIFEEIHQPIVFLHNLDRFG